MEKTLKELLQSDSTDRFIQGGNNRTNVKLFMSVDAKGRDEYTVTRRYFDDPEIIYRGTDEEEAVRVFNEND